ncbi:hypothetical protein BJ742DRAFT_738089 [Cladochytrium replicatum]|nr:hypothetical protein BJ742DRAFT_738089 [Cladochytrium replicatum]
MVDEAGARGHINVPEWVVEESFSGQYAKFELYLEDQVTGPSINLHVNVQEWWHSIAAQIPDWNSPNRWAYNAIDKMQWTYQAQTDIFAVLELRKTGRTMK